MNYKMRNSGKKKNAQLPVGFELKTQRSKIQQILKHLQTTNGQNFKSSTYIKINDLIFKSKF